MMDETKEECPLLQKSEEVRAEGVTRIWIKPVSVFEEPDFRNSPATVLGVKATCSTSLGMFSQIFHVP